MSKLHSVARLLALLVLLSGAGVIAAEEGSLVETVARVKPSIVGVGTYVAVRRPPARLLGTGFIVGDGRHVATNHHVINVELDDRTQESLVVFIGNGRQVAYRKATLAASDEEHDLAVLRFEGAPIPVLDLARDREVPEGTSIAFTGFPIGAVLGLFPVTHQGIVSAITPIAIPASSARDLTVDRVRALRDPFMVIQLDATAYPGNSGSPVYLRDSGQVIGIINQVFVKGTKENVLRDPSAITYAIPVRYLHALLEQVR